MASTWLHRVFVLLAMVTNTVSLSQIPQSLETWDGSNDLSGCGKNHTEGYSPSTPATSANVIMVGDRNRTFGIYIPAGYNESSSTPRKLIFDFHGNTETPEKQYLNSAYFNNIEGEKYIVVYPAGVDNSWESAPYACPGVSDLNFTTNLLAYLRTEYCIDSDYVYASGKSNGGGFVDYLACSTNGSEFAAFAMASAALYGDNSEAECGNFTRAILESHGEEDGTIGYTGHTREHGGGVTPDVRTWISWWAERDGCNLTTDKPVNSSEKGYEIISYTCDGHDDIVQHYDVYALGHCWPSINGGNWDSHKSICKGRGTRVLDFTSVVVDFFAKWNLTSLSGA